MGPEMTDETRSSESTSEMTHQRCRDSSKALFKDQGVRVAQILEISPPSKNSQNNPPTHEHMKLPSL